MSVMVSLLAVPVSLIVIFSRTSPLTVPDIKYVPRTVLVVSTDIEVEVVTPGTVVVVDGLIEEVVPDMLDVELLGMLEVDDVVSIMVVVVVSS
jgi:hypothetical protein